MRISARVSRIAPSLTLAVNGLDAAGQTINIRIIDVNLEEAGDSGLAGKLLGMIEPAVHLTPFT